MGEARRRKEALAKLRALDLGAAPPANEAAPPPALLALAEFWPAIETSMDELEQHVSETRRQADVEGRWCVIGPDAIQIQLWCQGHPDDPFMLWDTFELASPRAERDALLEDLDPAWCSLGIWEVTTAVPVADTRSRCPLFDLHPQRFSQLNPIGRRLAKIKLREGDHCFTETSMNRTAQTVQASTEAALDTQRLRLRRRRSGRQTTSLVTLGEFFMDFRARGRQIFTFPQRLIELFRHTDVDGIPLETIKLPYDAFYMWFGRQDELAVDGWAPDGVYVTQLGVPGNRVLQFALTYCPDNSINYSHAAEYPEPVYVQAMSQEKLQIGVGEAVDLVYAEKIAMLHKQIKHGINWRDDAPPLPASSEDRIVVDVTSRNAVTEHEYIGAHHEGWSKILGLVVNGLAYLSAYPEDRRSSYPENAPPELVAAATSTDAQAAKNALDELGYTAVHMCGLALSAGASTGSRSDAENGQAYDWIRGHWRNQPHGKGRLLRRMQWTMPYRRRGRNDGTTDPGHIYLSE